MHYACTMIYIVAESIIGEHFAFVEPQPAKRTNTASVLLAERLKNLAGVSMMDDGFVLPTVHLCVPS